MESGLIPMAERVRSLGQFAGTMVQKKAATLLRLLCLFAARLGLPAHNTTRFFSSIRPESPRRTQDGEKAEKLKC